MIIVLREDTNNYLFSEITKFHEEYPLNARGYLGSDFKSDDLEKFKYSPLFSIGWLIHIIGELKPIQLNMLNNLDESNAIILQVSSSKSQENLIAMLNQEEIPYSFIDNSKPDKNRIIKHISDELEITDGLAETIYTLCGGYIKDIIDALTILAEVKPVDSTKVRKYVGKSNKIPIFAVLEYLLGTGDTWDFKSAIKVVHTYRYAFSYLRSYLIKEITSMLTVSAYMQNGIVDLTNVKQYRLVNKNNDDISSMSEKKMMKIMKDLSKVSDEYLYFLLTEIENMSEHRDGAYKLILLLKLKNTGE